MSETAESIRLDRGRESAASLRRACSWAVWPAMTGAFVCAYVALGSRAGISAYLESTAGLFALSVLFLGGWLLLERVLPFRSEWNHFGRQGTNDLLHYAGGIVVPEQLARFAVYASLPAMAVALPGTRTLWPAELWLPAQVVLALALHELGEYTYHRLTHRVPALWRLHRLHHTSERLTLTRGFRHNALDRLLNGIVLGGAMIAIQIPAETMLWVSAIYTATGVPAHANVDVRLPRLLQMALINPEVHRIHHARDEAASQTNFGGVLMLWDLVFGTYSDPRRHRLGPLGLEDNTLPAGFWRQYLAFLHWDRWDAESVKDRGGL